MTRKQLSVPNRMQVRTPVFIVAECWGQRDTGAMSLFTFYRCDKHHDLKYLGEEKLCLLIAHGPLLREVMELEVGTWIQESKQKP